jgi:enoyl-[acyl-carrier protein] reductase I
MTDGLMKGRRGLVMGVANDHSIAWGIASELRKHGAELAFTYQGEAFGKRVKPLADSVGSKLLLPCDVEDIATVDNVFAELNKAWGKIVSRSCHRLFRQNELKENMPKRHAIILSAPW